MCVLVGAASWWMGAPLPWIVPPTTTAASLFVLGSYPDLVRALHRDSQSLSDIEAQISAEKEPMALARRKRMYNVFTLLLIATTAVSAGLICDYAIFYQGFSNLSSIEAMGVIGGMLSLAKRAQRRIGSFLIYAHGVVDRVSNVFSAWRFGDDDGGKKDDGDDGVIEAVVKSADDIVDAVIEIV